MQQKALEQQRELKMPTQPIDLGSSDKDPWHNCCNIIVVALCYSTCLSHPQRTLMQVSVDKAIVVV